MPREIAVFGVSFPAILLAVVTGAALAWVLDRVLARTGLYRFVWHPSLFRASLLVVLSSAAGLAVYR